MSKYNQNAVLKYLDQKNREGANWHFMTQEIVYAMRLQHSMENRDILDTIDSLHLRGMIEPSQYGWCITEKGTKEMTDE
jgi:hypothetical protein